MPRHSTLHLLIALLACLLAAAPHAQTDPRVASLSPVDLEFMTQQRNLLQDLAAASLGRRFSGDRERDLSLLQALLDARVVRPEQTRELQAMGVVLGDLLASELDLQWVIYEDKLGRSRALRDHESDNFLFPMTMISRRREVGNDTPVSDIYRKAHDIIASGRTPLPFQYPDAPGATP